VALSRLTRAAGDAAGAWYGERYVADASIVGVTLAIDATGATRLLGERESLLVADGRKLIDVAPVRNVPANLVDAMRTDAQLIADDMGLRNVCTVEFLVGPHGYSFMEVNARLIGAYEMIEAQTGLDLIALQLAIARGERLTELPIRVDPRVHVAEARIYPQSAAVSGPPVRVLAATRSRRSALERVERAIADCHPGLPHTGRAVLVRLADLLRVPTMSPSLAHCGIAQEAVA
jgi:biotin carboxylase